MLKFTKNYFFIICLPFVVYIIHVWVFGNWIIDDAGITFVYARNLIEGHGLVSQPGVEPVEGFSNFIWVIVFTPFFWFDLFDPIIIPKLVSILFVLFSFIFLARIFRLISLHYRLATFVVLILLAVNTSFVIWTSSGLENPLYVFLVTLLFYQMIKLSLNPETDVSTSISLAIIVTLLAMTRPDGLLYLFVFPIFLLADIIFWKKSIKQTVNSIVGYTIVFTLLYGSFILFRIYYFGDFFPNTFYAKGGPSPYDIVNSLLLRIELFTNVNVLFHSITSFVSGVFFVGLIAATTYLLVIKKFTIQHFVVFLILTFSSFIYVLLPRDWMGEFRFATPFFALFYTYLFVVGESIIEKLNWTNSRKMTFATTLIVVFIIVSTIVFMNRTFQFMRKPTVPFINIAKLYGHKFNDYATQLNVKEGSFLLPDVGGALFYSNLRIYDLAGLTDKTIARTLGKNQAEFYDYVFEDIKPTFIHTHGFWTYKSQFDKDERFRKDYIPIKERVDNWIMNEYGIEIYSGDYVRRDIFDGELDNLQQLQATE